MPSCWRCAASPWHQTLSSHLQLALCTRIWALTDLSRPGRFPTVDLGPFNSLAQINQAGLRLLQVCQRRSICREIGNLPLEDLLRDTHVSLSSLIWQYAHAADASKEWWSVRVRCNLLHACHLRHARLRVNELLPDLELPALGHAVFTLVMKVAGLSLAPSRQAAL